MIFFESRRRLAVTLHGLAAALGPERPAVACRELTKTHEEIARGTLSELAQWAEAGPLGEVTLVVAGAGGRRCAAGPDGSGAAGVTGAAELAAAVTAVAARQQAGASRRDAVTAAAREHGLPRRTVYNAVVRPD
jgi:16S rRNA (cytidine1402-2'-O)-methyltransferase